MVRIVRMLLLRDTCGADLPWQDVAEFQQRDKLFGNGLAPLYYYPKRHSWHGQSSSNWLVASFQIANDWQYKLKPHLSTNLGQKSRLL